MRGPRPVPRYEVRRNRFTGRRRVVFIGGNGQALNDTETLNSKDSVEKNIAATRAAAADAPVVWLEDEE